MDQQTLAVNLPAGVVYVSGSVNGIEYTWTNTDENRWEAVVARTQSEIYVVVLTLINDLGTTTQANFTLYFGALNLITDRTQRDVERWRLLHSKGYDALTEAEKAEWQTALLNSSLHIKRIVSSPVILTSIGAVPFFSRYFCHNESSPNVTLSKHSWNIYGRDDAANLLYGSIFTFTFSPL